MYNIYSMKQLRQQVSMEDKAEKKKQYDEGPKASYGYGGEFGVQKDRMDKVWTYAFILHIVLFTLAVQSKLTFNSNALEKCKWTQSRLLNA